MTSSVAFLLVTCCLENSRLEVLSKALQALDNSPWLRTRLTVFDNASSVCELLPRLTSRYENVFRSEKNVGYWSAIDWWLDRLSPTPPEFTYIIESDMIHYALDRLSECVDFLSKNSDVGSVRLHEYSVANRRLYDKDHPLPDSRRSLWQSHVNKVTGQPVEFEAADSDVWKTTFLTQLPALNRYQTMSSVFCELAGRESFSELDFQRLYWAHYQRTGILDGGIFHCNLNHHGTKGITGSWTPEHELKRLGYQPTRIASIVNRDLYRVTQL